MADTGFDSFNKAVENTNLVLKDIEDKYGWEERRNQSYAAVRTVLHTLRDNLTVEQAARLGAQLPLLLAGVFYDGWDPAKVPRKMSREEFVDKVRQDFQFNIEGGYEQLIAAVLNALRNHIDEQVLDKLRAEMSDDLKPLFEPEMARIG